MLYFIFRDGMISRQEMLTYFVRANCHALRKCFKHDFHEITYFKPTFCMHCTGLVSDLCKHKIIFLELYGRKPPRRHTFRDKYYSLYIYSYENVSIYDIVYSDISSLRTNHFQIRKKHLINIFCNFWFYTQYWLY